MMAIQRYQIETEKYFYLVEVKSSWLTKEK